VRHLEFRLLSFRNSTFLCWQHQEHPWTCSGIYCGILPHLSYGDHMHMHKASQQQLQTSCLAVETLSQICCSHSKGMHRCSSFNYQCINFATFLLLSCSKILFVSFTLLDTGHITNIISITGKCVLYYDPTVDCYSKEHFIFLILAVCVCTIFVVFSAVIFIQYPTRLCRRCIMYCGMRRWNALRTIVSSVRLINYGSSVNIGELFVVATCLFLS